MIVIYDTLRVDGVVHRANAARYIVFIFLIFLIFLREFILLILPLIFPFILLVLL